MIFEEYRKRLAFSLLLPIFCFFFFFLVVVVVVVVVVGEKGRGKGCGYVYGPLIHLASNDKSTFK